MIDFPDMNDFYFDPEILVHRPAATEHQPVSLPPDFFAYLQRASTSEATLSPAFDAVTSPSSTLPRSLPDNGISRTTTGELPTVIGTGIVRSEQVGEFWERYNAYPKYLRNVAKRKKRKHQKYEIESV
jgi:hypothetical protein